MPERAFFDMRYAYPGYTFLLILLIAAARYILLVLKTTPQLVNPELLAALLGVAFLLNGAPVGFLLSQPWYIFQRRCLWPRKEYFELVKKTLPGNPDRLDVIVAADFLIYRSANDEDIKYIQRRADLMNVLGSESIAIMAGVVTAIFLRCYLRESLVSPLMETIYFLATLAMVAVLIGRYDVSREHSRAVTRLINEKTEVADVKVPAPR
jgi:hypothetical protein